MNDKLNNVTILPPFKKFCMTIGELPSSYLESMTYYESLLWLTKYLADTVIPALNANGEAVIELQEKYIELKDYVDNYFDNLDVQEEINNKLDEMADSGELVAIISAYLQLANIFGYDTISSMAAAENLTDGLICYTAGQSAYNDGKQGYYKIRETVEGDVPDGFNIVTITNSDNLVGERLPNYYINSLNTSVTTINSEITEISTELSKKENKSIPKFIKDNSNYLIRVGTDNLDKHYLQFSIDGFEWHKVCDLSDDIFLNPPLYNDSYDVSCFVKDNEFYLIYDYVDESYNDWGQLSPEYFRFSNCIGISKTSDFKTWTKYQVETPLTFKQIANPRIYVENGTYYLSVVTNDGSLNVGQTGYHHVPYVCELNADLTETSDYVQLLSTTDDYIDPLIVKDSSNYYMFVTKEGSDKGVEVYKNSSLAAFSTQVASLDWYWNTDHPIVIEGSSLVKFDNMYYLYCDSVDHKNVVFNTDNIENWYNCNYCWSDERMGNAGVMIVDNNTNKNLLKQLYQVENYPTFETKLLPIETEYINYTNKTFSKFYLLGKRTYIAYYGDYDITVDKTLYNKYFRNDYSTIINSTGNNDGLLIKNLYSGFNCYVVVGTPMLVDYFGVISQGLKDINRFGVVNTGALTTDTAATFDIIIPGLDPSRVRCVNLTPKFTHTNARKIFVYVDSFSSGKITCGVLSSVDIDNVEVYFNVYFY